MGNVIGLNGKTITSNRVTEAKTWAKTSVAKWQSDKVAEIAIAETGLAVERSEKEVQGFWPTLSVIEPQSQNLRDLWLRAEACSTMTEQTPRLVSNNDLLESNSTRGKMYRALHITTTSSWWFRVKSFIWNI